jgi:hypothetical protein
MKKVTPAILFLVLFVLHWTTQFLAWARADAIRSTDGAHLFWRVLATPLFEIIGPAVTNEYFWLLMSINSLVWAAALTWCLTLFMHKS